MSADGHQPDRADDEEEKAKAPGGLTRTVFRGAGLAGGGYLIAQVLNLGVYIVLSRLLDPVDFGLYASATVLIVFGTLLTESGMHAALVQRHDRIEEAKSTAVVATVLGGLAFGVVGLAAAPLIGLIFDDGRVTELAAVASGLVLVNSLAVVPNAILQRRFSVVRWTLVDPLEVVAFGIVSIYFATQGLGPWALLIGQYAALATSSTLVWLLARWRPQRTGVSFGMWKELAGYGRHVLAATAIQKFGVQAADTLVIGRGLGPASLGQFRYAFRVATLPFTVLLAGAGYVIFPALARISADRARLRAAFLRSLRWMATIGFPAGMILVPLGPALTVIVFGDVWLPAGYAAIAMCAYSGMAAITAVVSELLKADGTPAPLTRLNVLITVATAGSMLALVPFGLTAAAAGMSIGAAAGAVYALRIVHEKLSIPGREMIAEIWAPLVASVVMALAVLPVDRLLLHPAEQPVLVGLGLLIAEGVLCVAIFAAVLAILAPHLLREARDVVRGHLWRRGGGAGPVDEPDPPLATP